MRANWGTGFGNGDGIGFWERDLGTGFGDGDEIGFWERDSGARRKHSEQRYSGKPDGLPERPKQFTINNKIDKNRKTKD